MVPTNSPSPSAQDDDPVTLRPGYSADTIRIEPVLGKPDVKAFLRLPWRVFRDDPHWVPPLLMERREHFSPAKNPYFQHARVQAWLAYRNGEPLGRICAQVDELYQQHQDRDTGFFGMLDAVDDAAIFQALTAQAETWLRQQRLKRVVGPFDLSINDQCGLLVEGFDTPPQVMMGHARPYYREHLESLGYRGCEDLHAYRLATDFPVPPAMAALVRKSTDSVRLRPLNRRDIQTDLAVLRDIFNDAWRNNFMFQPFTEAEFAKIGKELAQLLPADYVQIAEVHGEPAAMIVLLPNVNEAIRDLDGRLFPFGVIKLLWRLKVRHPRSARVPLMGVRQCHQNSLLGTALVFLLIDRVRQAAQRRGVETVELSWVLERNRPMRNIIENLGAKAYKRYRLYEKPL